MLGEFDALANVFERTAHLVAGLEGYPVFLPPRSMAQAEFIETLQRLAGGWKYAQFSGCFGGQVHEIWASETFLPTAISTSNASSG